MFKKTLKALADDLQAKKISSVELTQQYLDRIQQFDQNLNSFNLDLDYISKLLSKQKNRILIRKYQVFYSLYRAGYFSNKDEVVGYFIVAKRIKGSVRFFIHHALWHGIN